MSEPSASMLNSASIEKAERNEISNCARDMFKFVQNNYNLNAEEIPDPIKQIINIVPHILAEVRKNDQFGSTVSETTGADGGDSDPLPQPESTYLELVNISEMVPANPSSLPMITVADLYTCSMLKCLAGYPLYEPEPLSELSKEYLRHGVNVGDVGFVREDGAFDFLFNICPSQSRLINPPMLPRGFSLETSEFSATRAMRPLPRDTHLFKKPIIRTSSGEYTCRGPEGAVLELPEGATRSEAMNRLPFENLAARYGVEWYKYTMNRGRSIPNGSLYLITSFTKCAQWGIAVFDQPCTSGQGLKFHSRSSFPASFWKSTSKYRWKGLNTSNTKVANPNQGNVPNQCVFLRGYKIMIRQDIFDNIRKDQHHGSYTPMLSSLPQAGSSSSPTFTQQKASRIRGGGGTDPGLRKSTGGSPSIKTMKSASMESNEVTLHPNFNASLIHPSDLVNIALLSQNLDAKVALTHDDVWCDLLRERLPKVNYATLINIVRLYTSTVNKYGCVSLTKVSGSSNVLNEGSRPIGGTETSALDLYSLNNRLLQVEAMLSSIPSGQTPPVLQSSYPPNTVPLQEGQLQLKEELKKEEENLKKREKELGLRHPVDASDVRHSQIRSRITLVCAECKRLKLKCDRRNPCGNCTTRDTVSRCIYSPDAAEKVDLHSLNNRLIQVEATLSPITSGQIPPYLRVQSNTVPSQKQLAPLRQLVEGLEKQNENLKKREEELGLRPLVNIPDVQHSQIRSRTTVLACAECKRLKLKCDRCNPCGSCTKRGTVSRCIYSPSAVEKVDLFSLNNRLTQVEAMLSSTTSGQIPPAFQSPYLYSQVQPDTVPSQEQLAPELRQIEEELKKLEENLKKREEEVLRLPEIKSHAKQHIARLRDEATRDMRQQREIKGKVDLYKTTFLEAVHRQESSIPYQENIDHSRRVQEGQRQRVEELKKREESLKKAEELWLQELESFKRQRPVRLQEEQRQQEESQKREENRSKREEELRRVGLLSPVNIPDIRHSELHCAECKRLKLKCDRCNPCGSCTKRGTVSRCIYLPAAAEKVDLRSLNNQVEATHSSAKHRQGSGLQIQPDTVPSQEQLSPSQEGMRQLELARQYIARAKRDLHQQRENKGEADQSTATSLKALDRQKSHTDRMDPATLLHYTHSLASNQPSFTNMYQGQQKKEEKVTEGQDERNRKDP